MSKSKHCLIMIILYVFLMSSMPPSIYIVNAQSKTIIVPDDYPTISLAIQNARSGDTIFVKRGTYNEKIININKSISLIGEDTNKTILSLNPPLIQVNHLRNWLWIPETAITINTNDATLQCFTINLPDDDYSVGNGISAVGDRITLTDNTIANRSLYLQGSMLNITCNSIPGTLEVVGSELTISNNTIKDNLKIQGSFNIISANEIDRNSYFSGIYLNGSFNWVFGNSFSSLYLDDSNSNYIINNSFARLEMREFGKGGCSDNIISKNRVIGNRGFNDGIKLRLGENNTISANNIRNCRTGLTLGTTYSIVVENWIYLNNFENNSDHIISLSDSDHTVNRFDNGAKGNYYDNYQGNDANLDGVCDSPYSIQEIHWDDELKSDVTVVFFQDNYPLKSSFDIDSFNFELPKWTTTLSTSTPTPTIEPSSSPDSPETSLPSTIELFVIVILGVVALGLGVNLVKKRKTPK